ncbi:PREDICTED: NADH dehydrogenase [ubiquinone] 1 alpha subcomplex assembly factor 3-like [Priapulus caudatus]|uniref:NADH dehydrogenase [ubiquinone] 1 alpha subcomplex assembly factor 3 n=1 Tax=Priapulus caudatus TaxID=37621 RepID=A0ABM1EEI0_PRICU|nr:PREDICTED: NADH dehydrogenase [ubiquinone] 1 alpha subcomplex assembly factor 3-like [Priapulus caudatus]
MSLLTLARAAARPITLCACNLVRPRRLSPALLASPRQPTGTASLRPCTSQFFDGGETDPLNRTSVTIMNTGAEYGLMIDTFSAAGFRLNNGISVIGPMAIFARSVLSWNVGDHTEITPDSLSLFTLLAPRLDILVIGVGDAGLQSRVDPAVLVCLRRARISYELLPTEQACSTFNFLNSEGRYVAGAFIPPSDVKLTADDIHDNVTRDRNIYQIPD